MVVLYIVNMMFIVWNLNFWHFYDQESHDQEHSFTCVICLSVCLYIFTQPLILPVNVDLLTRYTIHLWYAYSLRQALSDEHNIAHLVTSTLWLQMTPMGTQSHCFTNVFCTTEIGKKLLVFNWKLVPFLDLNYERKQKAML